MIAFEHVTKYFGHKRILDDVSYTIEKGECFVIVGLSGAGKSVSLKHMVRLLTPDSGKVSVAGDAVSEADGPELARIRSRFGVLFQGGALLQWLTVGDNVGLPLRHLTKQPYAEIDKLAREKLAMVGLEDAFDKYPSGISGGMQKRAALARAIIMDPEIVLYDEPTSGLDPTTSRKIDALIDDLRKKLGVTSVVVTHDLHSALAIATRIGMVYEGKMIEIAPPEDFIKSEHPMVQQFLESQYITTRGSWERKAGL